MPAVFWFFSLVFGSFDNRNAFKINEAKACKKRLSENEDAVSKLKNLLDSVKNLEKLLKPLLGTGEGSEKDELFYGEFLEAYSPLRDMDKLYDKVRNYITQKPYSNDKIKLNFGNPNFLKGWAANLELQRSAQLFRLSDNEYYLGVIDKTPKITFQPNIIHLKIARILYLKFVMNKCHHHLRIYPILCLKKVK